MVVDSSAMIAILRGEPEAVAFLHAIDSASIVRISAATYVESAVVLDAGRDPVLSRRLDDLIQEGLFIIEPLTEAQARIARDAYRDFGKGSGHAARLNLGDCFAYALAKDKREPLLFKGLDFGLTDVEGWSVED